MGMHTHVCVCVSHMHVQCTQPACCLCSILPFTSCRQQRKQQRRLALATTHTLRTPPALRRCSHHATRRSSCSCSLAQHTPRPAERQRVGRHGAVCGRRHHRGLHLGHHPQGAWRAAEGVSRQGFYMPSHAVAKACPTTNHQAMAMRMMSSCHSPCAFCVGHTKCKSMQVLLIQETFRPWRFG